MKVLSITTATNHLSVAITKGKTLIAEKDEEDHRNHSEHLAPLIKEILNENQLTLNDIDRFAVAQGPGSYTGLRIGITTAKMFSSILKKDLVGVSTLAALAEGVKQKDCLIIPELDARNNNFFAGGYIFQDNILTNVIPDGHYFLNDLLAEVKKMGINKYIIFVGSSIDKYSPEIFNVLTGFDFEQAESNLNQIHAKNIGFLAENLTPINPDIMVPNYLKRTQAEIDWHKKTGKDYGSDSDYVEEV